jgi:Flp pilus assembly protein TadD
MKTLKNLLAVSAASLAVVAVLAAAPARAADTPGSNPSVRTPTTAERLAGARRAIAAGDWGSALSDLQAAQREDPRNADVHNLLGYTYRKRATPDLAKAFEHYQTALKLDPRHKGAHEYIGEAYLMDKKPAEAEKHLAELEKICGGRSCEEWRDLSKAIADYKAKN